MPGLRCACIVPRCERAAERRLSGWRRLSHVAIAPRRRTHGRFPSARSEPARRCDPTRLLLPVELWTPHVAGRMRASFGARQRLTPAFSLAVDSALVVASLTPPSGCWMQGVGLTRCVAQSGERARGNMRQHQLDMQTLNHTQSPANHTPAAAAWGPCQWATTCLSGRLRASVGSCCFCSEGMPHRAPHSVDLLTKRLRQLCELRHLSHRFEVCDDVSEGGSAEIRAGVVVSELE